MAKMTTYFVYVLRCADQTLYTGITTDIERRVDEHNRGVASKYTRVRVPVTIVYQEEAESRGAALKKEAAIKKLTRAQKLSLIAQSVCFVLLLGGCFFHRQPSLSYLGTKAPYPVHRVDQDAETAPEDCKAVHVEGLVRHGSRYLSDSRALEKLARIMQRENTSGNLTAQGVKTLKELEEILKTFRAGQLTEQGRNEQFQLGRRTAERFRSLFQSNNIIELSSAPKERIRESREYFWKGFSSVAPINGKMLDGDVKVLRYFDYCKSYMIYKAALLESVRDAAKHPGGNFRSLFTKVRKKDTRKIIDGINALCQLEYNLAQKNAEQGYCALLTEDDKREVFKQYNNKIYQRLGPVAGNGMACVAIEPMFERMKRVVNGESVAAANIAFAHAETVVPVSGVFELFAQSEDKWKAAEAGPMAANIQLVTYACSNGGATNYKVKLLYNETERHFNVPQCQGSYYCDFDVVKAYYEKRKNELGVKTCSRNDWEQYCNAT